MSNQCEAVMEIIAGVANECGWDEDVQNLGDFLIRCIHERKEFQKEHELNVANAEIERLKASNIKEAVGLADEIIKIRSELQAALEKNKYIEKALTANLDEVERRLVARKETFADRLAKAIGTQDSEEVERLNNLVEILTRSVEDWELKYSNDVSRLTALESVRVAAEEWILYATKDNDMKLKAALDSTREEKS